MNLLPSFNWTVSQLYWHYLQGLPRWHRGKEWACQCKRRRCRFDPWVGKMPWRNKWQPTAGYRPCGCKESDTAKHACTYQRTKYPYSTYTENYLILSLWHLTPAHLPFPSPLPLLLMLVSDRLKAQGSLQKPLLIPLQKQASNKTTWRGWLASLSPNCMFQK